MARGATRLEAAEAHGINEERGAKGWERARPGSGAALAIEQESPWSDGEIMAAGGGGHEEPSGVENCQSARRTLGVFHMLESGVSITETAPSVGYTRQHLSHLTSRDASFRAEWESPLRSRVSSARSDRLWHIHDLAASVIETSLDEGDPRIALEIFKHLARGVTACIASCGGLVSFRRSEPRDTKDIVDAADVPAALRLESRVETNVLRLCPGWRRRKEA